MAGRGVHFNGGLLLQQMDWIGRFGDEDEFYLRGGNWER